MEEIGKAIKDTKNSKFDEKYELDGKNVNLGRPLGDSIGELIESEKSKGKELVDESFGALGKYIKGLS